MAARSGKRPPKRAARKAADPVASWREGSDQLELLAGETSQALAAGQLPRARKAFGEYKALLEKHLAHEEDVSFPLAEKVAPAQGGPIKSLRVAHIGIRRDLEQVATHLAAGHEDAARAVFAAFLESFGAHERLEDQLIELLAKSRGTGPGARSR
ncbi:MAG TPA: hemerythrin domain-containing protein [Myxococcota bacterium]|nr:hemerythrin domain-containing protein [Myxococcota bacterium]